MNEELQALYAILESIDTKLDIKLKNLKFDYTVMGKVISNDGNGFYTVQIDGQNYTVKSKQNLTYVVGQVVYVTIIRNDFSNKIID